MGSGAQSYMGKGFQIYEEMHKNFHHIWEGRYSYMTLHPIPLNFLKYGENFLFFFISVPCKTSKKAVWKLHKKFKFFGLMKTDTKLASSTEY